MTLISNDLVQAPVYIGAVAAPHLFITGESPADVEAREELLDAAFGAARFEKTVERLREGRMPAPGLALVAKDAGGLTGTLRLWQIQAGGVPALLLGPLAVAKPYRSRGIGRRLMEKALFRARAHGHGAILLVGDASYYEPFGFARRHTRGLSLPGPVDPARFLGLELERGALREAKGLVSPAALFCFLPQPENLPRAA
ncbi:MAG: N-acetyltransferase [Beijerinckiaceae bacterium]|nr:N-acetyltransferase [Beijerinckiaceae bacterium]